MDLGNVSYSFVALVFRFAIIMTNAVLLIPGLVDTDDLTLKCVVDVEFVLMNMDHVE